MLPDDVQLLFPLKVKDSSRTTVYRLRRVIVVTGSVYGIQSPMSDSVSEPPTLYNQPD